MNSAFTPSANILSTANKARRMLYFRKSSFTCLTNVISVPLLLCLLLYSALLRPHLKCAIQANCPYLKKDINHLERIQMRATRWVKSLRGLTNEEWLNALKLKPIEKKKAKKWFGPDPQYTLQPNRSERNSIVQVLQKARAKKIINKIVSPNRENP